MTNLAKHDKKNKLNILYIYNYKDWAIHNVGKIWLDEQPNFNVTYISAQEFKKEHVVTYDLVWFGYLDLFIENFFQYRFSEDDIKKFVVSIHDPLELFPQQEKWKSINLTDKKWWNVEIMYRYIKLMILYKLDHIVTTSAEMKAILKKYNVSASILPTASSLPTIDKRKIKTNKCDILSVFEIYPRKNLPLMKSLQQYCTENLKIKFDLKIGRKILPKNQYLKLMDHHEIYICTSFQEGGPIPAMEAMQRGLVVISTPVGQIQDIIENNINGYICRTQNEFINVIDKLANNLELLHKIRLKSLASIQEKRNVKTVKSEVNRLILKLLQSDINNKHKKKDSVFDWFISVTYYRLYWYLKKFYKYINMKA
jgi:hypothetical protein